LAKSRAVALYLLPALPAKARFPYAPFQHFWGTDKPSEHPDIWAPTDFGRIVLSRGIRLPGRLVDQEGRPIAGQTIIAYPVRGEDRHTATTEADGSFVLGPLRPANYRIYGEGQNGFGNIDHYAPRLRQPVRVIKPVKVYLKEGVKSEPLVLREIPSVQIEVRFVDSQGRTAVGSPTKVWGQLPNAQGVADPFSAHSTIQSFLASAINDPEPEDTGERIDWAMQVRPDAQGRIVFRAPAGLQHACVETLPTDETIAYKTRLEENGPLTFWGRRGLGTLEADRTITIVSYRAPTVLATVKTADGPVPENVMVRAIFTFNGGSFGGRFIRQADGRYRSQSFMPDHEYAVSAWTRGMSYISKRAHWLNLPEGGFAELTLILRKKPAPPEVGKTAPSFSIETIEKRPLSLDDLRGQFVLLHFWAPQPGGLTDLAHLKAVSVQLGRDDRLAIISLCLTNNPADAVKFIQVNGLSCRQAVLDGREYDPVVADYEAWPTPSSFLIGPDGTLIAKDLKGEQIETAVTEALGRSRCRSLIAACLPFQALLSTLLLTEPRALREIVDPRLGSYSSLMRPFLAINATLLLTGIAAAQEHVSFPTQDGGLIHADMYGKGDRGVVLAHGGRFNKESWRKQAEALEHAGFRVLAIDFRGYGQSKGPGQSDPLSAPLHFDVLAAVRYLRKTGAKTVSVVGGSMGGGAAGDASIEAEPGEIDRLVFLGSGGSEQPEKMKGRKLFLIARDDLGPGDLPRLPKVREQFAKAPGPKELIILEGSAHAQFLFATDQGERVLREILRFLSEK
jgi:pimeloyl-ACP methyl ester carboxylesterase